MNTYHQKPASFGWNFPTQPVLCPVQRSRDWIAEAFFLITESYRFMPTKSKYSVLHFVFAMSRSFFTQWKGLIPLLWNQRHESHDRHVSWFKTRHLPTTTPPVASGTACLKVCDTCKMFYNPFVSSSILWPSLANEFSNIIDHSSTNFS